MMKRVLVVAADADDAITYGRANTNPDRHLSFVWPGHTGKLNGQYDSVIHTWAGSYAEGFLELFRASQDSLKGGNKLWSPNK